MSEPQDYTDKIAKLLQKAEANGTTPEEAEALTAAAERIMLKHSIDQAVIDAKRAAAGKDATPESIITVTIDFTGIYSKGLVLMAHQVTQALGELKGYSTQGRGSNMRWTIVGFESDALQAETLVRSLHLQAISAMGAWWKREGKENAFWQTGMEQFKSKRQFIVSFGAGAGERIARAKRAAMNTEEVRSSGAELVLVNKKSAVMAHVAATTRLHKTRGFQGGSDGRAAGRAAGLNANTGGKSVGAGRTAIG